MAAAYWQERALRFGHVARGLPAVCAYGMPRLYNETIHVCQSRALAQWLDRCSDLDVLDVGCGVGRWSIKLAQQGNRVLGVDISPRMLELARERSSGLGLHCEFVVGDVVTLDLSRRFEVVLAVTVLQHVTDDSRLDAALANLARHLARDGVLILLEVAPTTRTARCDTGIFTARSLATYVSLLRGNGLELVDIVGVDTALLRSVLLPATQLVPRWLARSLVTTASVLTLPLDLLVGRRFPNACWHKVLVARPIGRAS